MKKLDKKYFLLVILLFFSLFSYFFNESPNYSIDYTQEKEEGLISEESASEIEENFRIIVHLAGEVNNPGVYQLKEGDRLVDLLKTAGGLTDKADLELINLAVTLADGQKIIIPNIEQRNREENDFKEQNSIDLNNLAVIAGENNGSLININRADLNQLVELSGIGEAKAQAIINYREENGLFQSKEELIKISGIGEKTLDNIRDEISLR
ncbi:helix-hairpin-helix domain-containing protein [Halanaerobium sp. Z-7514]|uniref:Helix-hairpin-helix domain-containing protein n=1 Tax=Halanaerobium polyolivorans TaxID=2886943 RepID=A0AAW4X0U8_9FIRM|nr:helix-hairpin-helix domain-containing protein [Halanaerobium polyolivorans]MCC3145409.1 helix-hairpin-helix domain-containing protein [Halanaerobium polyolivorans]